MALSSVIRDVISLGSLKKIIRTQYKSDKPKSPLTADGWLRASAFAHLCPREEVLAARHSVVRADILSPDSMLTLLHGTSLHWGLQNRLLPELGLLVGKWLCLQCAKEYGGTLPLAENLIYRPDACPACGGVEFQYQELMLHSDEVHRVNGHPDGFLILPGLPGMGVFEAKSIGQNGAPAARQAPQVAHVIQVHIYMWLTGFRWAKILYWDKTAPGVSALIEHHVDRDEETIERIKRMALSVWEGIRNGTLPDRICASPDCNRALGCALRGPCFAPDGVS